MGKGRRVHRRAARPLPVRRSGAARAGRGRVFADTSYFVALLDDADGRHRDAERLATRLAGDPVEIVSTWEVVVETLTLLRRRTGVARARRFVEVVLPAIRLVRLTAEEESIVIAAYLRFTVDQRASLCDVVSWYVVTAHLEHAPCLSFDADFPALGLEVLAS